MEKHTFVIKKEVFETSIYNDITDCAMARTIRERLHPDRGVRVGHNDVDVMYANGERYEFSYRVSNKDVDKVYNAYDNPRNIKVTFRRVK